MTILSFPRQGAGQMATSCPATLAASLSSALDAARRLVALREKTGPLAVPLAQPVLTMADAIERDLLGFDVEQALQDLRSALDALDHAPPPAC